MRVIGKVSLLLCGAAIVAGFAITSGPVGFSKMMANDQAESSPAVSCNSGAAGMVWIPAGKVKLGSDEFGPEEQPVREVTVNGFWADRTEVTNEEFAAFVKATGYKTVAEHKPIVPDHIEVPAEMRRPGAIVFGTDASDGTNAEGSWRWVPGASWRHPEGPGSNLAGRKHHPVVQIAHQDALAYARWKGHSLPTEAEWEYAARGGKRGSRYIWGDEPYPGGRQMANSWQGLFPYSDTGEDGFRGTAPVGCFQANGFGLYDMAGNVWEWSSEGFGTRSEVIGSIGSEPVSIRGGSWLCAPSYCGRFRPSARQPGDPLTGTTHIGFRTIRRAAGPNDGTAQKPS